MLAVARHAPRLPLSDLACATRDVTLVRVRRVLVADADPSSVTFAPIELHPFAIRCEFRYVEEEDGTCRNYLVGGPAIVERAQSTAPVEITAKHEETLRLNRARYLNLAELYLELKGGEARDQRESMLEAKNRWWGEPVTRDALAGLAMEYLARKDERGLIRNLANERGVWPRTIQRHLDRAEESGLLKPGTRRRRPRAS